MSSLVNASILKGQKWPLKPNLLHRIFEEVAEGISKDETAIIFEDIDKTISHTYKELNLITNKLGRSISATVKNSKASPNSDGDYIVAVSMLPTDKLVITLLAIWKSGAAYLPIDPGFPKNKIESILNEAKPALVIYDADFEFCDQVFSKTIDDLLSSAKTFSEKSIKLDECLKHKNENLAIVLYTSGSTGFSKGVRLPHEVILNRLQWQFKTISYSSTEKVCVFKTAFAFVDSVCELWGPLLKGLTVVVTPKKITQNPEKLIDLLQKYKVERLILVPTLLRSLLLILELKKNKKVLQNLKIWICSGESLTVELVKKFYNYFPENSHILCNFYGSTEVMADVSYYIISGLKQLKDLDKVPIGCPIYNTIIYLLDKSLKPVDINSVGELWVSGYNLSAGYVNGRDANRFITNPHESINLVFGKLYNTGDFARIEKDVILYEGRTDSQVKIRGNRVDLSEIERAVNLIDNIEKGVVLCYHPGEMDQAILAFVTLKDGCIMTEMQIEDILKNKLASYMWPQVIIMEKILLLYNGKVNRQALLKSYESSNDDTKFQKEIDYTGVPDNQKAAAKILLETVAMVLKRSARGAIKIDANFYDLGGNSLNSIYTIMKLNEQGYYISDIASFIEAKDLREVLNHMSPEKIILPVNSSSAKYTYEMLSSKHRNDVFQMITDNFCERLYLDRFFMLHIYRTDYAKLLEKMWDDLIEQNLSFVAKTEAGKTVGVTLNIDARDEPEVEIEAKCRTVYKFLEAAEDPEKMGKLSRGKGSIFHSDMMATDSTLPTKENVSVMMFMEELVIKIAKEKNYDGICAINTSPLTQQLGTYLYGYEIMDDIQVNKYIAPDGTKPFERAPDSKRAIVCWKKLK